jgi:integrase
VTKFTRRVKAKKPRKGFPLFAHQRGHWCKKVRGEHHYFGKIADDPKGDKALVLWLEQKDDLLAGRVPRSKSGELTVADLCNHFLTAKLRRMKAGELSPRSFAEYQHACSLIVSAFGKRRLVSDLKPDDFDALRESMADRWGLARLSKYIQLIRTTFKHAADNGLIERPVLFGSLFNKPSVADMRKHKAASDKKLFTAAELRRILAALKDNPQHRSAVLLGINAGLGNSDISGLQFLHLDLDHGWLDFPREKTGLPRRCPLWKETVAAIKAAIAKRNKPKLPEDDGCVFINRGGRRLVQANITEVKDENGKIEVRAWSQDYVSSQFRELLKELKINGRKGLGFYSLRHTFATVALQCGDRDAVRSLMGHAEGDMLSAYDETGPSDKRRLAVTEHVRKWLFGKGGAA